MANLEKKKIRHLHVPAFLALMLLLDVAFPIVSGKSAGLATAEYPLLLLLDSYFFFGTLFKSILLAALAKRLVEIEEEHNMWQIQASVGRRVSDIALDKLRLFGEKLALLQILEWGILIAFATLSVGARVQGEALRLLYGFITEYVVALALLTLFLTLELKTRRPYATLFLSIIGTLTGILCMLTSKVLSYINPFAWMCTLMNIGYEKQGERFVRYLYPLTPYTLPISLALLTLLILYLKHTAHFTLRKDR